MLLYGLSHTPVLSVNQVRAYSFSDTGNGIMMMMRSVLVLLAVLLTACQMSSSRLSNIHLGMTESQVVQTMGRPSSRIETKEGVVFNYSLAESLADSLNEVGTPYCIRFIDGKVDSYGRDDGSARRPALVMPVIVH